MSNGNLLLHHQKASINQSVAFTEIARKLQQLGVYFMPLEVPAAKVSASDAVPTYLFNSQLLTKADGKMLMVMPEESRRHARVWAYLNELIQGDNPIEELRVFDLREIMCNGGEPACLLVVLNDM